MILQICALSTNTFWDLPRGTNWKGTKKSSCQKYAFILAGARRTLTAVPFVGCVDAVVGSVADKARVHTPSVPATELTGPAATCYEPPVYTTELGRFKVNNSYKKIFGSGIDIFNLTFDGLFSDLSFNGGEGAQSGPPIFICENNRKSNKIMHCVEKKIIWLTVL